jgi:5,10-methylene-tetrahydrofolate dehydrogenase/methenyl tetrahydrofolate cyclohydrolase
MSINNLLGEASAVEDIKENILDAIEVVRQAEKTSLKVVVDEINSRALNRQLLKSVESAWTAFGPRMTLIELLLHITQAETLDELVDLGDFGLQESITENLSLVGED